MSKVLLPEGAVPKTLGLHVNPFYEREGGLFEAILNGAESGVKLIIGVASLLIAVLGLVALLDLALGEVGGYINAYTGFTVNWSLTTFLGYLFYPFALIISIPFSDAFTVSTIIGERAILTEVVAYQDLSRVIEKGLLIDQRSAVVTAYALCGFAHVASMAIFVGGLAALAPTRKKEIASVGFIALVAATLACLMTACISGIFFTESSILLTPHVKP